MYISLCVTCCARSWATLVQAWLGKAYWLPVTHTGIICGELISQSTSLIVWNQAHLYVRKWCWAEQSPGTRVWSIVSQNTLQNPPWSITKSSIISCMVLGCAHACPRHPPHLQPVKRALRDEQTTICLAAFSGGQILAANGKWCSENLLIWI